MFKFIHAADIHLDSPLRGLSRHESAPADAIRSACRRAFENLTDLALKEEAAFVLLAGDLYDGDWKDCGAGIFLSRQMGRLGRKGIPVFAVAGNHDAANRMTRALDLPANMKMLSSKKTETVRLDQCGTLIHGRSFAARRVDENLAAGFGRGEKGYFNIGLLHTSLDGREGHGVYAPCSVDDLRSKGFQYWALGHVHKPEIVSRDPWIVFPGCVQGRHIREEGPRGCALVTVRDGAVARVEQADLDVFRWTRTRVDISGAGDMGEVLDRARKAIEKDMESANGRPAAMRIHFHGAAPAVDETLAYPERFEGRIKALGAEIGGGDLWIERVENKASGKPALDSDMSRDSALGRLLGEILDAPAGPGEIRGLDETVAALRKKIPPEAFGPDSVLDLDEPRTLERLIGEAGRMLIGRLLSQGDGP
ncbi:Metallophosphoesterase [Candidatus Desulfarcum epimagneticum]|uniref:Metallophosphoesterase n=1 Tax=uncultured Desulfobacteraceae bacterium TaxID=218296 RepID=A0A484HDK3_9BACT|nr:Metallophosphoesterase [uncultured Desulfobacteraceae bacterium]